MLGRTPTLVFLVCALPLSTAQAAPPADKAGEVTLDGYAEWHAGDLLIVDGQRVRLAPDGKLEGKGEARDARDLASVPLGYEMEVKGRRQPDGTVLAREVEAKPNGSALFEKQVLRLSNDAESKYQRARRYFTTGKRSKTIGRLYDSGPEVVRIQRVLDRVAPPYIDPQRVRVYVIDSPEWNAFAMGNFAIYVYRGLLQDMDEHELAIVLGHELAHATHEHTRKRFKKTMWVKIAALGVTAAAKDVDSKKQRAVLGLLTQFTMLAMVNGYGRDLEDQADRVGLRYAHEGGYDVARAPGMWQRFARKYGEKSKAVNFFFGNHSLASERAKQLQTEIALNYQDTPRLATTPRPLRHAYGANRDRDSDADDEADAPKRPAADRAARTEIREGMTLEEVRERLGAPKRESVFGTRTRWTYPDLTVIFRRGRVTEVRF